MINIKWRLSSRNAATIQFRIIFLSPPTNVKIKTYKTIISPVLYGCKMWTLTLWEENKQRVSEKWVLRRMYGPKKQ
jgi:hypothetical protein